LAHVSDNGGHPFFTIGFPEQIQKIGRIAQWSSFSLVSFLADHEYLRSGLVKILDVTPHQTADSVAPATEGAANQSHR
jgi:hypothetical protein